MKKDPPPAGGANEVERWGRGGKYGNTEEGDWGMYDKDCGVAKACMARVFVALRVSSAALDWGEALYSRVVNICVSIWTQRSGYTVVGYLQTCAPPSGHAHDFFRGLALLKLLALRSFDAGLDGRFTTSPFVTLPIFARNSNHSPRISLRNKSCHVHHR